ncbi:MAG: glycine zipper 2TM domain-containing protein, partial [Gemmatimonadetes bacterium]|nr:glycine zipper 2TM domain-containing protein [Gemmatimonadota bacterium]
SACETYDGPDRYNAYEAGIPARVDEGRVVDFRPVRFGPNEDNAAAGTVAGAVAGGVIGAASSRHDPGAFGVAGALLGAVAGNAIAKGAGDRPGFAYIVRRRDGSTLEVAQPDPYPIARGTRVYVSYGARVRITPVGAYAGGPPPPPPPPPPPY